MEKYKVGDKAVQGLFLRSEPVVKESTKITVLPMGQEVTKLAVSGTAGWWQVSTSIDGSDVTGFVNSGFLVKVENFTPPASANSITAVHLRTNNNVRRNNKLYAYPLNETAQPTRDGAALPSVKAAQLTAIVKWLDVENSARYAPKSTATYCNIYAYDYCYLAGVYLPRVWWTSAAIQKLAAGQSVAPVYAQTVNEINANGLFDWFKDYGSTFGWKRSFDYTAMQNAADDGQVVIICAQNKVPNKAGHICPVVPETSTHKARRNGTTVLETLQSQAGRINRMYMTKNWWVTLASTFRDHGFWINAS